MNEFRYRPAGALGWLALATDDQLLVVEGKAVASGVSAFDRAGSAEDGFSAILDELTCSGLAAMPAFALLDVSRLASEGTLKAIVRGGVQVSVTTSGAQQVLDGSGVSTWTEQSFLSVTGFVVVMTPPVDDLWGGEHWLPLGRGAAVVGSVMMVEASTPKVRGGGPVSEVTMVDAPTGLAGTPAGGTPAGGVASVPAGEVDLFGETIYRNVAQATAKKPEADTEQAAAEQAETEQADTLAMGSDRGAAVAGGASAGDHDGLTIMAEGLKKLRGRKKAAVQAEPLAPLAAPVLYLELSTGTREFLNRPLLVGRAPTANKVSGGALPRLVTIPGDKDISRSHAQFSVEGETVVVTDLHSRNGTQVILPGKSPQQLRQGEPTTIIVGTVVDLGGGVTMTVREEA